MNTSNTTPPIPIEAPQMPMLSTPTTLSAPTGLIALVASVAGVAIIGLGLLFILSRPGIKAHCYKLCGREPDDPNYVGCCRL